jgi:hypothetical protein
MKINEKVNMKKVLTISLTAAAIVLISWAVRPSDEIQKPKPVQGNYLGRAGFDPDNRQAQSQKKEGTVFCPPFCTPVEMATIKPQSRWHPE